MEIEQPEFRRELGIWSCSALVAGSMIGTGIFLFVDPVAKSLSNPTHIILAWVVGAAIAFCGSLCLAELAASYPKTGGIYVYLYQAFGPLVAFLYSWTKFLIMRIGSFGIPALAFARFFGEFWGMAPAQVLSWEKPIAIAVIVFLTIINIIGVETGSRTQNILTLVKVLCTLVIVGVGVVFAFGGLPIHEISASSVTHRHGNFWLLFCTALIPIMWTFGGWDEAPFVAEEVRNPERNLPYSILGGFILVALLYVFMNITYLLILSPSEIAASGGRTVTLAMERALGSSAKQIMALFLMISTFGAANGMALTGARIAYATGRNQAIFRWFAHTHPKLKTPVRSLIVQGSMSIVAIMLLKDPFDLLLYTAAAYWTFSGLMGVALIVMRKKEPQKVRPFKVWAYPLIPVIFTIASAGMVISVFVENWKNASITLVIFAIGGIVYFSQDKVMSFFSLNQSK